MADCVLRWEGTVAQWSARRPVKAKVVGSNPTSPASKSSMGVWCLMAA